MAALSLRTMTEAEFHAWDQRIARAFASEQVAAGNWSPEEALELAVKGNAALLPDGAATEGMLLLTAVRADGTAVGTLWIGLTHPRGIPDCAFLYDIEVEEEHRGAGYGHALLAVGEEAVRSRGINAMELNVFGSNMRAIRLYERSGYRVVTEQMRKDLRR
jgi:ribosomal protein S18 acetylase RimI-like enzyme